MNRTFFLVACISAAISVALGALGAHLLQQWLPPEKIHTFEIGVRYQFYHSLALFALALSHRYLNPALLRVSGWLFVAGMVFFSGSLYLLATSDVVGLSSFRPVLGPMTPLGGILFILGWLALFAAGFISSGHTRKEYKK